MLVVERHYLPLTYTIKNAGLIKLQMGRVYRPGPPRKYYTLTETGKLF